MEIVTQEMAAVERRCPSRRVDLGAVLEGIVVAFGVVVFCRNLVCRLVYKCECCCENWLDRLLGKALWWLCDVALLVENVVVATKDVSRVVKSVIGELTAYIKVLKPTYRSPSFQTDEY